MCSATVVRDGMLSPSRVIKSPEEVVVVTRTSVHALLRKGLSPTKVRGVMAARVKDPGMLGYLDAKSQELARQVTEVALSAHLMWRIWENGITQAGAADAQADSAFRKARKATNPSKRREYLDVVGASLDRSKMAGAIADQAYDLSDKLSALIAQGGPGSVSFPLPPRWKSALANAPLTDSIPFGLAYAKGQLATWRALDPELMRSLTAHRNGPAKPARTSKSIPQKQPKIDSIPSSRAIPEAVGAVGPRPDAIQELAALATVSEPQTDCESPRAEDDPQCGKTDCQRSGVPDAQPMASIDHGSTSNGDGDDPTEVTFLTDEP